MPGAAWQEPIGPWPQIGSRPMTAKAPVLAAPTTGWRNRITGSGEEAPDQLLANPANWRIHPK